MSAGQGDQIDAIGVGDQTDARGESRSGSGQVPKVRESDFVSDTYNMNYPKRGTAVIINNKNFHPRTRMGVRTGTDVDADGMYELFDELGFESIQQYKDLTVQQMKDTLEKVSDMDHQSSDCFACVILSHGEEGYIFGTDNKISIDELVFFFKGHNCTSLAGKPKMFFIQACRGSELDSGTEVPDSGEEEIEADEGVVMRRIPTEADFLMMYSVVPGYFSWRNSSRGSWFIQALVQVFKANWPKLDVLTMMTRVNKKVAYDFESNASEEHMNKKKQIPCITSMLTKDLYFSKKN